MHKISFTSLNMSLKFPMHPPHGRGGGSSLPQSNVVISTQTSTERSSFPAWLLSWALAPSLPWLWPATMLLPTGSPWSALQTASRLKKLIQNGRFVHPELPSLLRYSFKLFFCCLTLCLRGQTIWQIDGTQACDLSHYVKQIILVYALCVSWNRAGH